MLNNVPVAGQTLGSSRDLINANFATINTAFSVNHVQYNDGSGNQGMHNFITFPIVSPATPPTYAATQDGLYNLTSSITGIQELFIHKQIASSGTQDIPFTASLLSTNATPATGTAGWSYLPSGLLIKWGAGTADGATAYTFPVASNIPVFTTCLSVTISTFSGTSADVNEFARLISFNATTINVWGSFRTTVSPTFVGYYYLAIGF